MADTDWLSLGATVLGGLLGGNESAPQTTSTSKLDPRIEPYIYGANGILPGAQNWFNQNSGGLNQQMVNGLNRQHNVYSDPQTAQGYTNQQNLGQALLGAPVAGNPFTSGQMSLGSNQVRQATNPVQQPNLAQTNFQNPATQHQSNPYIYTAPAPVAPAAPAQYAGPPAGTSSTSVGLHQGDGQGNNSTAGGGYGGSPGTGVGVGDWGSFGDFVGANAGTLGSVAGGLVGGPLGSIVGRTLAEKLRAAIGTAAPTYGGTSTSYGGTDFSGAIGADFSAGDFGDTTGATNAGWGGIGGFGGTNGWGGGTNGMGGGIGGGIGGGFGGQSAGGSADGSW